MHKEYGTHDDASAAAQWLQSLGHDAKAVQIEVYSPKAKNSVSCVGARYNDANGNDTLYILIDKRNWESVYSRKHYYTVDGNDWYIAAYSDDNCLQSPYNHYHPFGHSVMIKHWNADMPLDSYWDTTIDAEVIMPNGTYPRLSVVVTEL